MTSEQIFKKAIKKAVKNKWDDSDSLDGSYLDKDISGIIIGMWHINKIIFSPSFAKAYWGKEYIGNVRIYPAWQYHQHKMLDEVQAGREPLKYIERFL